MITNHPQRLALHNEIHARPYIRLGCPSAVSFLAFKLDDLSARAETAALVTLCERLGAPAPAQGSRHHYISTGAFRLRWERHSEFVSLMVIVDEAVVREGVDLFARPALHALPEEIFAAVAAPVLCAMHIAIIQSPADLAMGDFPAHAKQAFGDHHLVGSQIADDAAVVLTDFQIHADNSARIVLINRSLSSQQIGREVQRLCEIEAYRMMAMLGFPLAQQVGRQLAPMEAQLTALTEELASGDGNDDADLLHRITALASQLEALSAASGFRFSATRAYNELVRQRLEALRETRLTGYQKLSGFLLTRFSPAMATCDSASRRIDALADRIARGNRLLRTRVDVQTEGQNQAILQSMHDNAQRQLQLQQTVEGLSVAAILYYVMGLIGYGAKALKSAGWAINVDLVIGISLLPAGVLVFLGVSHLRQRLTNWLGRRRAH
jgi:uncharacterized membrane-anchored protein